MTYRTLRAEQAGAVLWLTLDRPDRNNGINDEVIDDLNRALDAAELSPECRTVAIRGRDGVFSTGMDLAEAGQIDGDAGAPDADGGEAFYDLMHRFTTIPRTIVSVVDGTVAGGGVGLVAASDFVYATPRSTFSLPEALWGLLPCCVVPYLVRRTGFQPAYAMTLSTQPVSAADAARSHLVDVVHDQPTTLVSRLTYRLSKLDGSMIGTAKRYFGRLHPIPSDTREVAVGELARLMSGDGVKSRLRNFAESGAYPWER